MKRKTFLILLLFFSVIAIAQQRRFAHIGLPEGLPQETVLCMATDSLGMVWLGTSDGLVRYDGTQFHLPLDDSERQLDVAGYRIGAVVAHKDYILAGTGQKGLLAYHTTNETTQSLGTNNLNCTTIVPRENGFLAGFFNGSVSYFNDAFEENKLKFENEIPNRITTMVTFKKSLFIGTDDGQLFYGTWSENTTSVYLTKVALTTSKVNFLKVQSQELLIGTAEGLFTINNITQQPTKVEIPFCESKFEKLNITDVVQTNNTTFIATSSGLFEWTTTTCATQYTSAEKNHPFHLNANAINDLHVINETLLIGHITLDLTEVDPPTVFTQPTTRWNLDNPSVFAVCTSNQYLFSGTSSGLVISLVNDPTVYKLFPKFRIRGITIDSEQNIWFVTGQGAYIISKEEIDILNPTFISIPISEEQSNRLSSGNLRNIFIDRQDNIWITTFSQGLCKFVGDISNNDFSFRRYAYKSDAEKLPSPLTLSMSQDEDNNYWVSTQKGLSKMTLDEDGNAKYATYTEAQGLSTNGVLSSYVSKDGTLWVASRKGLNKYLQKEDRFVFFGKRDGLSNTFVYNCVEDSENTLWLTTNGGLFRFNTTTEQFANYLPKDGVQSTEFNLGAIYSDETSGMLYVGGISGLNVYNPKRVNELDKASPLVFTRLTSKGEPVRAGLKGSHVQTGEARAPLTFRYDAFPISLTYSALDYRPSKNNTYQYRLLPQDKQWNDLTNNQDIQLLNLSPGSYTLELRGLSRGIPWQQSAHRLPLKITPPWYGSNLAYLIYGLLIASIIFIYYRISLQRKLAGEEAKRLQDLDSLKTRFITNITHEFRTPLTIILGYIDNLKQKINTQADQKEDLQIIENNSSNLLHLVNQMLDLAKLEKGRLHINYQKADIVAFARLITNTFHNSAQEKGIELVFKSNFDNTSIDFDSEKVRQVLSNLISNSIKFTEKGRVSVFLSEQEKQYTISVKDTGRGISEEEQLAVFERFYQVENNSFKVSQGTGIGLALTKELVQLMNGTIQVKSAPDIGTTFTITLPITRLASEAEFELKATSNTNAIEVPEFEQTKVSEEAQIVLVVEDNPDMSRYIGSCLQPYFKVLFASNGQEGLATATERTPDIIISDVMMPVLDGFQMTTKLQQQETTNHIPIILLTSKATQADKLEGLDSGADAYLTKPFQKQELLVRMNKLIAKRRMLQEKYALKTFLEPRIKTTTPTDKNEVFLQKTVTLIQEHIEDSEFGSKQLAETLALSESQLYRKLKAITNTSTALFIRSVRLEKAKELLCNTTKNISEIAYETGFNDPNWFGKVFKEAYGSTPTETQKQQ